MSSVDNRFLRQILNALLNGHLNCLFFHVVAKQQLESVGQLHEDHSQQGIHGAVSGVELQRHGSGQKTGTESRKIASNILKSAEIDWCRYRVRDRCDPKH